MGEALYQRPRDGATRRLAERGAGVSWESLTEEVRRQAEVVVADTLACGIGARAVSPETVRMVQAYSAGVGSVGKSVVLATGERAGASVAAWANGALCHALDFDDAHIPSIAHFGAPCVAAALGLLQQRGGEREGSPHRGCCGLRGRGCARARGHAWPLSLLARDEQPGWGRGGGVCGPRPWALGRGDGHGHQPRRGWGFGD